MGYSQALVTAHPAVECLDPSRERWTFTKERASEHHWWWVMNSEQERARGRSRTYLTPALWKGSRLDTSLGSTLERSASGMSAVGQRDVFSSWEAKARVSVLGRGFSWTCGRQRTLSTRKNRGIWIEVFRPRDLVKEKGLRNTKLNGWNSAAYYLLKKVTGDRCIWENYFPSLLLMYISKQSLMQNWFSILWKHQKELYFCDWSFFNLQ